MTRTSRKVQKMDPVFVFFRVRFRAFWPEKHLSFTWEIKRTQKWGLQDSCKNYLLWKRLFWAHLLWKSAKTSKKCPKTRNSRISTIWTVSADSEVLPRRSCLGRPNFVKKWLIFLYLENLVFVEGSFFWPFFGFQKDLFFRVFFIKEIFFFILFFFIYFFIFFFYFFFTKNRTL